MTSWARARAKVMSWARAPPDPRGRAAAARGQSRTSRSWRRRRSSARASGLRPSSRGRSGWSGSRRLARPVQGEAQMSSRPAWMYWSAVGCALWSRLSPVWYGIPAGRQSRSAVRCEAPRWEEAARATWAWFGRRRRGPAAGKRYAPTSPREMGSETCDCQDGAKSCPSMPMKCGAFLIEWPRATGPAASRPARTTARTFACIPHRTTRLE